CQQGYGLPLTF
nr:immunoglobulin light chain junction region [Macaca mulatta]MOV83077.1 immunoglobulin light chain junction region [Macaca mulatta]MOV84496.1 immunoglobulin light chain junction region [Macaca mulatta]